MARYLGLDHLHPLSFQLFLPPWGPRCFRSPQSRFRIVGFFPGVLAVPKTAFLIVPAAHSYLEPSTSCTRHAHVTAPQLGSPLTAAGRNKTVSLLFLVLVVPRGRPIFFLTMSAEMANEIKLISGRSHPELSEKIAKRYVETQSSPAHSKRAPPGPVASAGFPMAQPPFADTWLSPGWASKWQGRFPSTTRTKKPPSPSASRSATRMSSLCSRRPLVT